MKWASVNRTTRVFENKFEEWLQTIIHEFKKTPGPGRPKYIDFAEASERTKKRRTENLSIVSPDRLYFVCSSVLRKSGHSEMSSQ